MKVRTAEAKLRTRLRAFLRHSGYIDHMPLGSTTRDDDERSSDLDMPTAADADGGGGGVSSSVARPARRRPK